jgi:hypothetical protein
MFANKVEKHMFKLILWPYIKRIFYNPQIVFSLANCYQHFKGKREIDIQLFTQMQKNML